MGRKRDDEGRRGREREGEMESREGRSLEDEEELDREEEESAFICNTSYLRDKI